MSFLQQSHPKTSVLVSSEELRALHSQVQSLAAQLKNAQKQVKSLEAKIVVLRRTAGAPETLRQLASCLAMAADEMAASKHGDDNGT